MRAKEKKTRSFMSWNRMLFCSTIAFVGLVMFAVNSVIVSYLVNTDYKKMSESTAAHIACLLDDKAEGDYAYNEDTGELTKGGVLITDAFLEKAREDDEDIRHTIFWEKERVLSDLVDGEGKSLVGTTLSDNSIWEKVQKGDVYTAKSVNLYGTKYTVSYYPLKNDNTVVGMVFVGVNQSEADRIISQSKIAIFILAFLLVLVNMFILTATSKREAVRFDRSLDDASLLAGDKKDVVTGLGHQTVSNMEQIDQAIEQVSQAVTEQASHTEEIMGSMTEFGDNLDRIIAHMNNTNSVIQGSIESVDELQAQVVGLESVSKENSQEILHITEQIQEDSRVVLGISKMIDVINDIAFQITILSFNASVEAARAGEAGKGFAVVADSIKELSDKTKESLEDITRIVQEVNAKMDETSVASNVLSEKNEAVISALNETKKGLHEVQNAFNTILENISEVMEESRGIVVTKNQVIETVSSLAAASEENAAMSEQIKATTDEVIEATHGLLEEIDGLEDVTNLIGDVKEMFMDNKYRKTK